MKIKTFALWKINLDLTWLSLFQVPKTVQNSAAVFANPMLFRP
jgi:hypothetical protein